MKKILLIVGILAIGFLIATPQARAGLLTSPRLAAGMPSGQTLLQDVHWRRYWHCHGPRWDRRCHGVRRYWRDPRPRGRYGWDRHWRRDGWHRDRGHRDRDRGHRGRRGRD